MKIPPYRIRFVRLPWYRWKWMAEVAVGWNEDHPFHGYFTHGKSKHDAAEYLKRFIAEEYERRSADGWPGYGETFDPDAWKIRA